MRAEASSNPRVIPPPWRGRPAGKTQWTRFSHGRSARDTGTRRRLCRPLLGARYEAGAAVWVGSGAAVRNRIDRFPAGLGRAKKAGAAWRGAGHSPAPLSQPGCNGGLLRTHLASAGDHWLQRPRPARRGPGHAGRRQHPGALAGGSTAPARRTGSANPRVQRRAEAPTAAAFRRHITCGNGGPP